MNKPRILLFLSLCAVLPCSAQTNPIDSLSNLDEVVVTGYRTISRERAAGSYDIVSSKEVEKRHTLSTSAIFDGIVAGMQGQSDGRGGTRFTIRGVGTMYADELPLIVVDGFPIIKESRIPSPIQISIIASVLRTNVSNHPMLSVD